MVETTATRREWWKIALLTVPAILLAGSASGWLAGSGEGNAWYNALQKPFFQPPGWAFGVIWPILYVMLGLALAMVLAAPASTRRRTALILFFAQLALNFAWSPIFFAGHDITLAKYVIYLMAVIAGAAAGQFFRLRRAAGLLLLPYLAWLVFAATVNGAVEKLNPGASASLLG